MRRAKIVITLGPATDDIKTIEHLITHGVNVFRLNFSHATHEYHGECIKKIRKASTNVGKEVAILQDISGPKIRICELKESIPLAHGDILTLSKTVVNESEKTVTISYPEIIDRVEIGEAVYFADGIIRAKIVEKTSEYAKCEIQTAQTLHSRKGINFPNSKLNIDAITQKDEKDLIFGSTQDIDIVALSFVSNEHDILKARSILEENGANPLIFGKIEKPEAIRNIKKILKVADGIMVARGDMGVELGLHRVPNIQKKIIKEANKLGKPTITATQMLTSMMNSPFPTRAEVSDVANAVLDGSDAVMLSDETTVGHFPLEAVDTLHQTIVEAEKEYPFYKSTDENATKDDAIAAAVTTIAKSLRPHALIAFSRSGSSAMAMAKYRPKEKILVSSYHKSTLRKLQVVWGINAIYHSEKLSDPMKLIKGFLEEALEKKHISLEKNYVLTIGAPLTVKRSTNDIKVLDKVTMEHILEHH